MTTKDYQETERIIKECNEIVANYGMNGWTAQQAVFIDNLAKTIKSLLEARATLTTAQGNEEVASGGAVAYRWYEEKFGDYYYSDAPNPHRQCEAVYLHPPTPSPSNVLVEALRGAQELIGKHSSDESEEGWLYIDAYKSIEKILAAYSASKGK